MTIAARPFLIVSTVVANVLLWISYLVMKPVASDFGKTPKKLQKYLLISATVAYLALLVFVGVLAKDKTASNIDIWVAVCSILTYFGLQMAFLPLTRAAVQGGINRNWSRALLLLCTKPIMVLTGLAIGNRNPVLISLGLVVTLHVVINDALLFGFTF